MADYYPPDGITATKGDLIEFQRYFWKFYPYFHFAVYTVDSEADDGQAINQTTRPVGDTFTIGLDSPWFLLFTQIVEKTITSQCKGLGCRVNNLEEAAREMRLEPLNPDTIVERAREFLREKRIKYYNVLNNNCEHFATKCRYEVGFSLQARNFRSTLFRLISVLSSPIRHLYNLMKRRDDSVMDRIINEVRQGERHGNVAIVVY